MSNVEATKSNQFHIYIETLQTQDHYFYLFLSTVFDWIC